MKKILIILFLYSLALSAGGNESKPQTTSLESESITVPPSVQSLHIHVDPHFHNHNVNETHAQLASKTDNTIHASAQSHAQSWAKSISVSLSKNKQISWIHDIGTRSLQENKALLTSWIKNNKWMCAGISIGSLYSLLCVHLMRGNFFLASKAQWCNWLHEKTIIQLQELTQKEIRSSLLKEIHNRYFNPHDPTNTIIPLVLFMKDLEHEKIILSRYLKIARALKKCRLFLIFPTNIQQIEKAQDALNRLSFFKHTFISWAAEVNLEKALLY